ncbi:hypothetical protein CPB86DRAFT_216244 [Serendipita vermifera]|nr:hypothetical protein CPB86DRAFT_216244 [Serendipita vermifera]
MTIFNSFNFDNNPIRSVCHAYETLATSSRSLEVLHISTQPRDHLRLYEGGNFAKIIVRNHGLTIRSVLLDEITISPHTLLSLCSRCPNPYTLGFNVPKKASLVELSVALSFSVSLSSLRLTATNWTAAQMEEECSLLLIQGLSQLNSLLIRWGRSVRKTSRVGYTLWKTRWTYDQSINAPRRSLEMSTKNEAEWDLY